MPAVDIIINAVDNTKGAMNSVSGGFNSIKSAAAMVVGTVAAVSAAVSAAALSFTNYSDQVKAVGRVTGASAEESSRLIQITDDLFISYESLSMAMKAAVKNGIEPNIESLAVMSDAYLALAPGLERSTYLLENFGKSGFEMGKMMEVGADGLRAMAAATPSGLILSEADTATADKLKISFDNLGDAVSSFGLAIMTDLSPSLVNMLSQFSELIGALENGYQAWVTLFGTIERMNAAQESSNKIKDLAIQLWQQEGSAIGKAADSFDTLLTPAEQKNYTTTADMILNHADLNDALTAAGMGGMSAADAIKRLTTEQTKSGPRADTVTKALTEEEQKLLDLAIAAEAAATSQSNLNMLGAIMNVQGAYDNLTQAADDFATKQAEVDALMQGGQESWQKIDGKWELTAVPQETRDSLADLKTKLDEARQANEKWIKQFIFSMIQAKLSEGGLTDVEFSQLLQVGEKLGLIDPEVAATTQAVMDAINAADATGLDKALEDMQKLFAYDGKVIQVTVNTTNTGAPPPEGNTQQAGGGTFDVPAGYPNDTYMMGLSSGEHVSVTTTGQQAAGGGENGSTFYISNATFLLERGAEGEILARLTE
jgi:hypothetical protein